MFVKNANSISCSCMSWNTCIYLHIYDITSYFIDSSINDVNNISEDLRDRCGLFTNEVQNLIDDSKLLVMIKDTGVINIKSNSSKTSLLLSANINKSVFENILTLVTNKPNIYSINKENKFIIELNEDNSSLRRTTVIKLLNEII